MANVLRLQALGPPLDFEFHFGAFLQSPVAGHLNGGKVNEHIFSARPLDESITLRGVKPLHYTLFSHYPISYFLSRQNRVPIKNSAIVPRNHSRLQSSFSE
jgi:hypothetical protein